MTKADNTTRPVNFIRFHGLTLLVVENGGVEYVQAKALSDLIGLAWRKTRETIASGDNAVLYGTRRLTPPVFNVLEDPRVPQKAVEDGVIGGGEVENPSLQGDLYMRLDRARFFLARVNTAQIRVHGSTDTADFLLALQIEWAEALHQYETIGVAVKKGHKDTQAELATLYKLRVLAETAAERAALSELIAESFAALGHPLDPDAQQTLPLGQ